MAGDYAFMRNLKSQKKKLRGSNRPQSIQSIKPSKRTKRSCTPRVLNPECVLIILEKILTDITTQLSLYTAADFTRDMHTLKNRVHSEGVSFATKILPKLSEGLLSFFESGIAIYPGFKLARRAQYPLLFQRLFAIATSRTYSDDSTSDEIVAVKGIYQLSLAFSKIRGAFDESALRKQYSEFCSVDAGLGLLSFSDNDPILRTARAYMADFICHIDLDDISCRPRPGPGATNTPTELHERFEPHVMYKRIDEVLPYAEWFYSHPWDVVNQSRKYIGLVNQSFSEPTSRFKFVPKKVGKARGICIEENEVQYYQQAFRRLLSHYIKKDPLIGNRIVLEDQSINASLALENSASRSMATLDMSEASDRIARSLVWYLFQDHAELAEALMVLSTRTIIPPVFQDGVSISLPNLQTYKFAPMGSALCFPVMSLVHFMLLRSIILHSAKGNSIIQDSRQVYVYGDDLIVPSQYADIICKTLPLYGMKINVKKSFSKCYFRESCGMHAYKGVEITPVLFKHTPEHQTCEGLLSNLAVESQLFSRGWFKTADFIRKEMCISYRAFHLLDHDVHITSNLIGFKRSTPLIPYFGSLKVRKNADLQINFVRVPIFKSRKRVTELISEQAYLRSMLVTNEDAAHVWDTDDDQYVAYQWIPESVPFSIGTSKWLPTNVSRRHVYMGPSEIFCRNGI